MKGLKQNQKKKNLFHLVLDVADKNYLFLRIATEKREEFFVKQTKN